ncbi:lectin [Gyrodon lividus]|nr:lectin [Gyrodon lividus]
MSYSIKLRLFQTNPARGCFSLVECTCWNFAKGGTWSHGSDGCTLTMGGSGTSGTLRFMSDKGERILVAVGVHNYKRWCDVVTGLASDATGVVVNAEYYNDGKRAYMREKQLAEYSVTSAAGTKVEVKYTVTDGNALQANIIIG